LPSALSCYRGGCHLESGVQQDSVLPLTSQFEEALKQLLLNVSVGAMFSSVITEINLKARIYGS